ncbi:MAG: caspase family protein, partial [Fidelibacterota bacterium]
MITKKQHSIFKQLILSSAIFITMSAAYGDVDYYALLIGINDYHNPHEDFKYAIADIYLVRDMLVQVGDWSIDNIRILEGSAATEEAILDSIEAMGNNTDSDDVCLIMFSGHGSDQGALKGLVAYDDRPEYEVWRRVSPSELSSRINTYFDTDKIVVILDASDSYIFEDLNKGVILMSTVENGQTHEDEDVLHHGVLSYYVAKGMAGYADLDGESISAEDVFDYAYPLICAWEGDPGEEQEPEMDDNYTTGDLEFLIKEMTLSGTLTRSEIWSGATLTGNVFVPSGKTLRILTASLDGHYIQSTSGSITRDAGATIFPDISVKQGSTIKGFYPTVSGAYGAADPGQDVYMGSGTYYGSVTLDQNNVNVYGNGRSNTTLYGIVTITAAADLKYLTLSSTLTVNSGSDIDVYQVGVGSQITLNNCSNLYMNYIIGGTTSIGVDINGGDPGLYGMEIIDAYWQGMYAHNYADPRVYDSVIKWTIDAGIYLTSSSDGYIDNVDFCVNDDWDIYAEASGTYAGECYWSDHPAYTTHNVTYYGTDNCGLYRRIAVDHPPVTEVAEDEAGRVAFEEALEQYWSVREQLLPDSTTGERPEPASLAAEYGEVIRQMKEIVSTDRGFAVKALGLISNSYWTLGDYVSVAAYLDSVIEANATLKPHAQSLLVSHHLRTGDPQAALALSDVILNSSPPEDLACEVLYNQGVIYHYYLGDLDQAVALYRETVARYPDHPTGQLAAYKLEEMGEEAPVPVAQEEEEPEVTELSLSGYPNPFNPTATVRFGLPEAGNVTLIVYDLLGHEVLRLVEGYRDAGWQTVIWDGRDAAGREAPTGLYLARLVTP